jgi:hypothetical protein
VKEAITIGRLIRREALQTFVVNASCVSACVLVLASGVERYVLGGRVGIRSPYSEISASQEAYERTRQRRGALNGAIRAYFREMDIPEALLAAMNRVPSDEVNWLNLHQLSDFQLIGEDAAWREWKAANEAKKLGVSLSELLARKAKVGRICQGGPTYSSCAERIMHGN